MTFLKAQLVLSLFLAIRAIAALRPGCEATTYLLPHNTEYRKHCEAESGPSGSDPKWPCFTLWRKSLKFANATVTDGNDVAPSDFFLIKNGTKKDFTIKDPTRPFIISWKWADLSMAYSDYDDKTGCYKISLSRHSGDDGPRIWVSDENGDDRDVDTEHHQYTSKTLCTKWAHIYTKEDSEDQ